MTKVLREDNIPGWGLCCQVLPVLGMNIIYELDGVRHSEVEEGYYHINERLKKLKKMGASIIKVEEVK